MHYFDFPLHDFLKIGFKHKRSVPFINQVAMFIQTIHTINQSYLHIIDNFNTVKCILYYTN